MPNLTLNELDSPFLVKEDPMPKFNIQHNSSHSIDKTYDIVKGFLSKGEELKRFDEKVSCGFDDSKKTCSIQGSQFKAEVSILANGANSKVSVEVDLPFLLMPFKGKIQESLGKMFSKHLS